MRARPQYGAGDTIFALSSGQPPAGIAVVRISGAFAGTALHALAGRIPEPRRATLASLCDPNTGELLDRGLMLWLPGPATATGEDLSELHLHGGRSVIAGVLGALNGLPGLRPALPGEFTRRAFENGRVDLAEAEGLADLLAAETAAQRRNALALSGGVLSRSVDAWRTDLLALSARVEASLDFADEDDVAPDDGLPAAASALADAIETMLERPAAERLRDGIRVVLAGPPNAGKSTLLNALVGREAAITAPTAGTTRDLIEAPVAIGGVAFLFTDTAGLHAGTGDAIERIGIDRARAALDAADIILWLGDPAERPDHAEAITVHAQCDRSEREARAPGTDLSLSAVTGAGMDALVALLLSRARTLLPSEGEVALNRRQRDALADVASVLRLGTSSNDPILLGESLRLARAGLDRVTGRAGVEDMLDALFGQFCIGK